MEDTALTGRIGEDAASDYLRGHGFRICDRNWRRGRHEIDIVAVKGDTLHFVEVKTRKAGGLTTPEAAITHKKLSATGKAVSAYLAENPSEMELQFDVIAIDMQPDGTLDIRYLPCAIEYHW